MTEILTLDADRDDGDVEAVLTQIEPHTDAQMQTEPATEGGVGFVSLHFDRGDLEAVVTIDYDGMQSDASDDPSIAFLVGVYSRGFAVPCGPDGDDYKALRLTGDAESLGAALMDAVRDAVHTAGLREFGRDEQVPNTEGVDLVRSSIIAAMDHRDPARIAAATIRQQQQDWRAEILAHLDNVQARLDRLRRVVTDDIGYGSVLPLAPVAMDVDRMVCQDIGAEQAIYAIERAADPARREMG
jgi:hypothetical protein